MKIDKKIIAKIEGEAELELVENNNIIEFAKIKFYNFRGFERILKNRPYLDALVINPRICGICGHSHLLATAKAIESALNAKITKKAEILREITTGLEIVENHIKWFYITLLPIVKKTNPLKALKISSLISKAIALIAGQYPHNAYIMPGGVSVDLTNIEILKVKEMIKIIKNEVEFIREDLDWLLGNIPDNIGSGVKNFLVLGDNLFFKRNGEIDKVYEKDGVVFYDGMLYEVGPLARNYKKYKNSDIKTRILARVEEIFSILDYLLNIIDKIDLSQKSYIKPKENSGVGVAAIEAPRGSLIHKVDIKDGVIKSYDIIVPTNFNLSSNTKDNPSPAQIALMNEDKKWAELIFKCFDICAVCATH